MIAVRRLAAVAASTGAVALVAAVPAQADYPSAVSNAFTKSCVAAAQDQGVSKRQATRYCNAALSCIEDKLSVKQLIAANKAQQQGKETRGTRVIAQCVKKAGGSV